MGYDLCETLQYYASESATGALLATSASVPGEVGRIYLHHGQLAHVSMERSGESGWHLLMKILHWPELELAWAEGDRPPTMDQLYDVSDLLFRLASLEDEGIVDPEAVQAAIGGVEQKAQGLDLEQCMVELQIQNTEFAGQSVLLDRPDVIVGRLSNADFCLPHPTISSRHASFTVTARGVLVRDLGSTNGTFVNKEQVQERLLGSGDTVWLGSVACMVVVKPKRRFGDGIPAARPGGVEGFQTVAPRHKTQKLESSIRRMEPLSWKNLPPTPKKTTGKILLDKLKSTFGRPGT